MIHASKWKLLYFDSSAGNALRAIAWVGWKRVAEALLAIKAQLPTTDIEQIIAVQAQLPRWLRDAIGEHLLAKEAAPELPLTLPGHAG
jgi:hypothetical protein